MCTVSMLGDEWSRQWPDRHRAFPGLNQITLDTVSRSEFDALKYEVEALKKLLEAAKEFDAATGQPDCEIDEKVELIRKVAELVGVDMDSVFGQKADEPR